jgi:hypothetical protein
MSKTLQLHEGIISKQLRKKLDRDVNAAINRYTASSAEINARGLNGNDSLEKLATR